jgi:hypothetical protein
LFRKTDLLKDHLRERFYVTAPGVPAFTGLLISIAKANLEFADVRVGNAPAEGASLFIERSPSLYLQRVTDATG